MSDEEFDRFTPMDEFFIEGRGLVVTGKIEPPLAKATVLKWLGRTFQYKGRDYKVIGVETFCLPLTSLLNDCGLLLEAKTAWEETTETDYVGIDLSDG